jgi:hypothetical protein
MVATERCDEMTRPIVIVVLLAAVFPFVRIAKCQFTTASLEGIVTDSSGAGVPGASVTVLDSDTGFSRVYTTGTDGSYLFPTLPVGTYQLSVEKSGFSKYVQSGIILTINRAANQPVLLQLGAATQEVTVTADASLITTNTATITHLINQEQILDLPLDGRHAESLVFLAPGTVDSTNNYCVVNCQGGVYPSSQEAIINGGGTQNVSYQMDGTAHNDSYVNTNLPFPNPDALQEFSLQSNNMSAEYGNSATVVNIVTKSGTNVFHGDIFEFLRNGALNARNFFAPLQDTLKRNQFGGSLGGPIKKDQLFFFGTYQGTRIVQAAEGNVQVVPTAAQRNGDFSSLCTSYSANGVCQSGSGTQLTDPISGTPFPSNQIPSSRLSTAALNLLKNIPLPNGPDGQLTFLGSTVRQDEDQFMTKIDWIRGKNMLSGRYFFTRFNQPPDTSLAETNLLATSGAGVDLKVQTLSINDVYTVTPGLLFNTWFGWNSQTGGNLTGTTFYPADFGIQIAKPKYPDMEFGVGGFFSINSSETGHFNRGDKSFREVVSWQKDQHSLSFGADLVRLDQDVSNPSTSGGVFNFSNSLSGSNLADFMLGQISQFQQGGGQYQDYVGTLFSLFVQDNWRVSPKLTLNLGLRWDPHWPYRELEGRINCFVPGGKSSRFPNAPINLLFAGDPGCPTGTGQYSNLANFAPRLGFAYHLARNTVVRGGAGMYYVALQTSQQNGQAANAPFAPRINLTDVRLEDPFGSAGIVSPFPAAFGGVLPASDVTFTLPVFLSQTIPRDFRVPVVPTWNLTLEHQFSRQWLVSAAYVGNVGYRLSSNQNTDTDYNFAIYIPGQSTEANTQQRRIYPNFSHVQVLGPFFRSNYNALQLNVQKRFAHGLSLLANYTFSHALDNFDPANNLTTDPYNRNFDYGNSIDNIPNIFHLSEVWQLPHLNLTGLGNQVLNGWTISSTAIWQNGFPFTLYCGCDNSFSGIGDDRPDFTGTHLEQAVFGDRSHGQMVSEYFNTALFVPNAIGTFGNIAKNNIEGPGLFRVNLSVLKDFRIVEKASLQFRAEFFNIFNNVNFYNPGNTVGTGSFGQITSAQDPRILQFALKIMF